VNSATAVTSFEILAEPLNAPLVRDLLAGDAALARFYAGHPLDRTAYQRKAAAVDARLTSTSRERLRAAIRPLSAAAATKLDRIIAGDGYVVTTGQQAGLFGGPLYTVNKILSAARLAAALEASLNRPVLPLFWIAADDHDWAEVRHTSVLDAAGNLLRIAIEQDDEVPPHAMADRQLGPEIGAAVKLLDDALAGAEFSADVMRDVRAGYAAGNTVAAAFEALLAAMFQGHDLLLLSSAHPAVREAALPILLEEVRHADAHASILEQQTARLVEAGYNAQVEISPDAANLFYHDEHGRERLVRERGGWTLRRTRRHFDDDELSRLLRENPTRFSPNVLLRPVVESAILPTLAYVGGPAEVSYFGQIGCLFHAHAVEPPLVFPRFRVTLVEARVRRVLEKFGLDRSRLETPLHELVATLVREDLPPAVPAAVGTMREALNEGFARMNDAAATIDPTLIGWLEKRRNAALIDVADAEQKIARHLRRRMRLELGQLERASNALRPGGAPQERTLNLLPFLARHGRELLREIEAAIRVELGEERPAWTGVRCGR
jgi:bacillithiol synthase